MLPPHSTDEPDGRVGRQIVFCIRMLGAFSALALAMSVVHASVGEWGHAAAFVVTTGLLLTNLLLLRRHRRLDVAGHVTAAAILGIIVLLAAHEGGLRNPVFLGLPLVPVLAQFFGGDRAGLGWLVASGVTVAAMALLDPLMVVPGQLDLAAAVWRVVATMAATGTLFALVYSYDRMERRARVALEESHRALVMARQRAEAADQAKSLYLSQMAHEIRAPLGGIVGLAHLLDDDRVPPEQQAHLRTLRHTADLLGGLVDDVLDLAKVEAGALELDPTPARLDAECRAVAELLRARADAKGIELRVEVVGDGGPAVLADRVRFSQVLLNLLSNAIKFTEAGHVVLRLEVGEDGDAMIEVADTGIGMSPSQLATIFQPFRQAEASIASRFGGTGLGLAVSQRIVEAMGGALHADSAPGEGSRFTARIPFEVGAEPAAVAAPRPASGRSRHVLVVDDSDVNRTVAERLLERLGCDVEAVTNGVEALSALERAQFDVVFMDCRMPVMDGVEATRQLRARGDRTPVVALTAAAFAEERARCAAAGMNDFLTKPFTLTQLHAVLDREWAT